MSLEAYIVECLMVGRSEAEREEATARVRSFYHYKSGYDDYLKRNPNVKADGHYPDDDYAARMSGLYGEFVRGCERNYEEQQEEADAGDWEDQLEWGGLPPAWVGKDEQVKVSEFQQYILDQMATGRALSSLSSTNRGAFGGTLDGRYRSVPLATINTLLRQGLIVEAKRSKVSDDLEHIEYALAQEGKEKGGENGNT